MLSLPVGDSETQKIVKFLQKTPLFFVLRLGNTFFSKKCFSKKSANSRCFLEKKVENLQEMCKFHAVHRLGKISGHVGLSLLFILIALILLRKNPSFPAQEKR